MLLVVLASFKSLNPVLAAWFAFFYCTLLYNLQVWQKPDDGSYKLCMDGEDPTCNASVPLYKRDTNDHCKNGGYLDREICWCTKDPEPSSTSPSTLLRGFFD